jgi:hypothetical protein
VVRLVGATTIPPDVLDPKAPLPTIDLKIPVLSCSALPPGVTVTKATITLPPPVTAAP